MYRTVAQPDHLPQLGSSRVLVRFALTSIILICCAAFSNVGFAGGLAALTWMASIVSAFAAVIRRERPFERILNHWDETIVFAAAFCLISIFIAAPT